jgi:photosystem II stability/assembly factor-like uncharacterized protein
VNNGWFAGAGVIGRTSNGGASWSILYSGNGPGWNSIFFINSTTGWISGEGGQIKKTTNGGSTWYDQTSGSDFSLNQILFIDINNGWAVGANMNWPFTGGTILRTTNSGASWTQQLTGITCYSLNGISFIDLNNGWVAGDNGIILHTTNGGVSFVEEEEIDEMPTEFLLSQNYPNPFNPSTKIKYSVPQTSQVVIKVFDILGNEIEILVNEEKPAGTFEITWSSANLPSGVYFYQLKAGNYIETKKMLLLK